MKAWLLQFINPPDFADLTLNRRGWILHFLSILLILTGLSALVVLPLAGQAEAGIVLTNAALAVLGIVIQVLIRFRALTAASLLAVIAGWIVTTLLLYFNGGLNSPFLLLYFVVMVLAAVLLGSIFIVFFTLLTVTALVLLYLAAASSRISPPDFNTFTTLLVSSGIYLVSAGILFLGTRFLQNSTRQSNELQQLLYEKEAVIQQVTQSFEARVRERTEQLELRTRLTESAAEVSAIVASILDLEVLSQQVVDLIQERFSLYYVGLFLLDEEKNAAVLHAGTGERGRQMLERRHSIKVGDGMIGWSIANNQARVALDADDDLVRLIPAELPETRSEAAIPMRSRGQVIGALTVQSSKPQAFSAVVLEIFQLMADQIGVAIDNARLYEKNQAAIEVERLSMAQNFRETWAKLLRSTSMLSYRYDRKNISQIHGEWTTDMLEAAGQHKIVQRLENEHNVLHVPIKIRDRVVGISSLRKPASKPWTDAEIKVLQTLVDQLGITLDSARLYSETQRRAIREQLVGSVAARMRETMDVETVLRTALGEIGAAMNFSEVEVRMGQFESGDGHQSGLADADYEILTG